MKVIICGAGRIGYNIARYLVDGGADVTIIDQDPSAVNRASEDLNVRGIVGYAAHPDVLERAGAEDTEMLIAVTKSDEINMIACQVAHSLFNVHTKIARILQKSYLEDKWKALFSRDHLPIDAIISPDKVSQAIAERLAVPGAFDYRLVGDNQIALVGVRLETPIDFLDRSISDLSEHFKELTLRIVAINRDGERIFPSGDDRLFMEDEVYFTCETVRLPEVMRRLGHNENKAHKVVIIGGGNIGLSLAQQLEKSSLGLSIRLIESNKERAELITQSLNKSVVYHGDALDSELLQEAGIKNTQTVISVTDDDEVNILSSLLAKRYGAERAITLINSRSYSLLISQLGIETVIHPSSITVSSVLQFVRRGKVYEVHSIGDDFAEVIDVLAMKTSSVVGKTIRSIKAPKDVVIGGIVRQGQFIYPEGDTKIEADDRVIIFAENSAIRKLEKLFAVRLDYF